MEEFALAHKTMAKFSREITSKCLRNFEFITMRGSLYIKAPLNKVIPWTKFHNNAYYDMPRKSSLLYFSRTIFSIDNERENYLCVSCNIVRETISITASYVAKLTVPSCVLVKFNISHKKFHNLWEVTVGTIKFVANENLLTKKQ